jgi:hypothetical protein
MTVFACSSCNGWSPEAARPPAIWCPFRQPRILRAGHPILGRLPVLRDIRELSTLTALLRDGHADAAAQGGLQVRLRSVHTGDDRQWIPF